MRRRKKPKRNPATAKRTDRPNDPHLQQQSHSQIKINNSVCFRSVCEMRCSFRLCFFHDLINWCLFPFCQFHFQLLSTRNIVETFCGISLFIKMCRLLFSTLRVNFVRCARLKLCAHPKCRVRFDSLGFVFFSSAHADCHSEFHRDRIYLTRFQWIMANNQLHGTTLTASVWLFVSFCLHLCVHRVRLKMKWHHFKRKCFHPIDGICKSLAFIHAIKFGGNAVIAHNDDDNDKAMWRTARSLHYLLSSCVLCSLSDGFYNSPIL